MNVYHFILVFKAFKNVDLAIFFLNNYCDINCDCMNVVQKTNTLGDK